MNTTAEMVRTADTESKGAQDAPHIEVTDLVARYGDFVAIKGVSFTVARGEHLTLLGPSGCGKTTMLRCIAGFETPSSGEIRLDGRPIFSSKARVNVPTEHRGLSMVFQSYAIWPHMSVFDNVAYGLRVRHVPAREIRERVMHALEMVRLDGLGQNSAAKLSGGQQQRVALARSIVFNPTVLLFDEPLSNLDAKLRARMRVELRELQARIGVTSVYVTHDQEEALAISDRIIVMNVGTVEQVGPPAQIYDAPRTAFVADFVGSANLIDGRIRYDLMQEDTVVLETAQTNLVHGRANGPVEGENGTFAVRTAYPRLSRQRPDRDANVWQATILQRIFLGDFIQYVVEWDGRELMIRRWPDESFDEGEQVYLTIDPRYCVLIQA